MVPPLQLCFLSECDPHAPDLGSLGSGMSLGHPYAHPMKLGSRTGVIRQCVQIQRLQHAQMGLSP